MKTIGQIIKGARPEGTTPKQFAKQLKISESMLKQFEMDRPVVITDETAWKLLEHGKIKLPQFELDQHNYVARACNKAKNWSKEFREQVANGRLPISPELQAASDAIDKELEEHGTVGGIPVDTSKMVQGPVAPTTSVVKPQLTTVAKRAKSAKKAIPAAPAKAKPAQPATAQGFLPGFLDQMSNVRVQEMVTEMLYKRIQARIDERLDEIFGKEG
jgi:hypothetical protein